MVENEFHFFYLTEIINMFVWLSADHTM